MPLRAVESHDKGDMRCRPAAGHLALTTLMRPFQQGLLVQQAGFLHTAAISVLLIGCSQ